MFFFSFAEIVEELISKGQQLDAVNFAFEAGLESKFPPAPLLRAYLQDSRKPVSSLLSLSLSSARARSVHDPLVNALN